jgi:hypothetical protein
MTDTAVQDAQASPDSLYIQLVENNEWEGETWHFYIPVAGNEKAIGALSTLIQLWDQDPEEPEYAISAKRLTEAQVDALVEYGSTGGYMAEHNKLAGRLDAEAIRDCGDLYKGSIRDFMRT